MKVYSHTLEPQRKIAVVFFFIVSFMDYLFKPNIFIFPRMKIKASCFSCAYTVDRALGLQIIL